MRAALATLSRPSSSRCSRGLWLLLAVLASAACGSPSRSPEDALRARLGIPETAHTVLVFGQTSHLDIDWQKTFTQYYGDYVRQIFTEAGELLEAKAGATYAIAEMAYLQHFLAEEPAELPRLRALAQRGALRVVGGGMTSPDTLLPETELLLRDYLHGLRFADETLGVRPRAAWLPDSFGHGATAPDVLASVGLGAVAFARIDGAPSLYELLNGAQIRPGTTAARLQALGAADFRWRGAGGAEVQGHFLSRFLYCTGDDLDYAEPVPVPGLHFGTFHGDDPEYLDAKIDEYVAALRPWAKTPYLFVPVGCDFQAPKPRLLEYLAGYNARRGGPTGVFAVAAPFDDYAELVGYHREKLPLVEGELGPYYMGFYATRPEVKRRVREAARPFFLAEVFAPLAGEGGRAALEAARPAFELLLRANHHDFVTGTSNDAVVSTEQLPLCALVEEAGQRALAAVLGAVAARLSPAAPGDTRVVVFNGSGGARTELLEVALPTAAVGTSGGVAVRAGGRAVTAEALPCPAAGCGDRRTLRLLVEALAPFAWRTVELRPEPVSTAPSPRVTLARLDAAGQPATGAAVRRVVLQSERVRAVFDGAGFALVSLQVDGREALRGPSFVDGAYLDTGGLWRLGHEMEGCVFSPLEPPVGADAVSVEVLEVGPLRVRVAFRGASGVVREAALEAGAPGLDLALTAAAENHTSRTLSFDFAAGPGAALRTSTPGGFTERVPEYVYAPTFWPAPGWAAAGEWTVLLRQATGVRFSAEGALELLTVRNAPSEQCDYEGGTGTDFEAHRLEWRVVSAAGPGEAERASQAYNRPLQAALVPAAVPTPASSLPDEGALLSLAGEGVVTALKPAYDGDGLVVRALLGAGPLTVTVSPLLGLARASRADVVERDLGALPLAGGVVTLDAATLGSVATVRLRSPPSAR